MPKLSQTSPAHTVSAKEGSLHSLKQFFSCNILLILGSMFWWGSHYLLLWNTGVASADSLVDGYDGRFLLTVGGTVIALGAAGIFSSRKPGCEISDHRLPFFLFAVLSVVALGMLAAPLVSHAYLPLGECGAVLSGIGNSFALIMYGELHARVDLRCMPLVCAVEIVAGVVLFFAFMLFPAHFALLFSAAFVVASACCWFVFSRKPLGHGRAAGTAQVDIGLRTLLLLAVLTGLGYGLVRTFAFGNPNTSAMVIGLISECIGTLCSALLLAVVFIFQRRLSLFDICLLFVVPLVATGLLLVALRSPLAIVPAAINQGGFACFFVLMWYFAATLSSADDFRTLTRDISFLFLVSQLGQLIGALTPPHLSHELVTSLVYLILIASMLLLYWRSKRSPADRKDAGTAVSAHRKTEASCASSQNHWGEIYDFSPREMEIVLLLAERTPYRQIAEKLFISENTVKTHVRNIYKKAGVTSRESLLEALDTSRKKGEETFS
ncbi:LuxR C-terminal-related transcriptional regulator [Adlercreutzia sp. R21]|uniref:helix-turn-helix transcriptional regulator n=1 Tax=Adlercreutzia wanghongyangiae TaxID=3111451 RepID=UPI002DBE9757|nr:LuxR C-terminal-related transcriptional regulator [Adlercreutzia sp. R21]MEC4184145.1 LuxR C-terminal-related transcriptional regulator [Adlercreutzia sp. R21]